MGKLKIIAEKSKDSWGVYAENEPFTGMGETLEDAIFDMKAGIAFYIKIAKETGKYKYTPYLDGEYEIEIYYDISSLLNYYGEFLSDSGLQRLTGISKTQIWRYTHGKAKPRPEQRLKIINGLHRFGMELAGL